jgi:hypothetical protein
MHGWALARRSAISASLGYARVSTGLLPDQFAGADHMAKMHTSGRTISQGAGHGYRLATVYGL